VPADPLPAHSRLPALRRFVVLLSSAEKCAAVHGRAQRMSPGPLQAI